MPALPLALLQILGSGTITGIVTNGTTPVAGAEVVLILPRSRDAGVYKTDSRGGFSMGSVRGRFDIYVVVPGYEIETVSGTMGAAEPVKSLRVTVRKGDPINRVPLSDPGKYANQKSRHSGPLRGARLVRAYHPVLPEAARKAKVFGTVRLRGTVRLDGSVYAIEVLFSPSPILDDAAKECFSRWRFQPGILNGEPVEVLTERDVVFAPESPHPARRPAK